MIIFMAMPFIMAFMNFIVPLQIGARDVAFPRLNAIKFLVIFHGCDVIKHLIRCRWIT